MVPAARTVLRATHFPSFRTFFNSLEDLLFRRNGRVFSYRVAGICIQNGRLLLQKPTNDDGFAFPGGHAAFGETNEETLIREFREEIGASVSVEELKWVGEIFFSWDGAPCRQICLYYQIRLDDPNIPTQGMFMAQEELEGRAFQLEFHWIPLDKIKELAVYPPDAAELLTRLPDGVQHFVYRE